MRRRRRKGTAQGEKEHTTIVNTSTHHALRKLRTWSVPPHLVSAAAHCAAHCAAARCSPLASAPLCCARRSVGPCLFFCSRLHSVVCCANQVELWRRAEETKRGAKNQRDPQRLQPALQSGKGGRRQEKATGSTSGGSSLAGSGRGSKPEMHSSSTRSCTHSLCVCCCLHLSSFKLRDHDLISSSSQGASLSAPTTTIVWSWLVWLALACSRHQSITRSLASSQLAPRLAQQQLQIRGLELWDDNGRTHTSEVELDAAADRSLARGSAAFGGGGSKRATGSDRSALLSSHCSL